MSDTKERKDEEEGRRVPRTWSCVGTMGLLLSLGAICREGSDIGVTPICKNEEERKCWKKETRLDCGRGEAKNRRGLVVIEIRKGHAEVAGKNTYTLPGCIPAAYIHHHLVLYACNPCNSHRPGFSRYFQ